MISQKICPASFLEYLAKNAGSSISISSADIIFLTKMQKGKPPKIDLPLLKNDITNAFYP